MDIVCVEYFNEKCYIRELEDKLKDIDKLLPNTNDISGDYKKIVIEIDAIIQQVLYKLGE